jgi:hypothetical protein
MGRTDDLTAGTAGSRAREPEGSPAPAQVSDIERSGCPRCSETGVRLGVEYAVCLPTEGVPTRDGGIRTRDPLNPIQTCRKSLHDEMPDFQGVPRVGAGIRNPR